MFEDINVNEEITEKVRAGISKLMNPRAAKKAEEESPAPIEIPIEAAAKVSAPVAKTKIDISVED